jgi:hypothetical protein
MEGQAYSLANTPLKAAQPPLAIASMSHAGLLFGRDMGVSGALTLRITGVVVSWLG